MRKYISIFGKLFGAFLFSAFVFASLVEIFAPAPPEKPKVEKSEDEKLLEMASFYDPEIVIESENLEDEFWKPKIIEIIEKSDIGFLLFYFLIFLTLLLQSSYLILGKAVDFLAIDLNLQAPPMLGVGGTIYALVNTQINSSTSIVETLSAVLIGAGLTTLLGIFIFIINHFLSRFIKIA
jgi:hypothetical protein